MYKIYKITFTIPFLLMIVNSSLLKTVKNLLCN